jgi:serine/threonine-protein kinase
MNLSAETWPTVSALLDEALALPAEERETWLQSLAGEHAAHRDTLRDLLARAGGVETEDFLATLPRFTRVASAAERGPLTELAASESIGPYRLISELGTGGMGAVWLAERSDGQLKRKVALKLPRLVWAKGLAERMARERDILASLEHPNIARLYDAGVDQHGRPYLALEYVEGQPIDVYARERGLGVKDKLQLLLQVCSAVAFAHSRLVVHRDLKPSNILVTQDGQVRLLDFGIAKLMEGDSAKETQLTQLAGRALTLDYASPEQIKGEPIGTASDVYSLGVVAYEVLTGAKPYRLKRGSAGELEDAITEAQPRRASDAAATPADRKAIRGDIDAILAKALGKTPANRYITVDALADDVRRHLASEPVLARPDSTAYRARKFLARYRLPVAITTVTLLTVSGTAVFALLQASEARLQRDRALLEAETTEEVSRFVVSLFAVPDPPRIEIVDRGRDQVLRGDTKTSEAVRGRMLKMLGDLYVSIGNLDSALTVYEEAVKAAMDPSVADRRAQAEALAALASAQTSNGMLAQGRENAARAVALLDEGVRDEAKLIARATGTLGVALTNAFEYDQARPYVERAVELNIRLSGPHSRETLVARQDEARLNYRSGKADLGIEQLRALLDDLRTHLGPRDADVLVALENLGSFLGERGHYAESEARLKEAIAVRTEVYGPDHPTLSAAHAILGRVLHWSGEPKRALPVIQRSIELERKGNPRPTPYLAFQHEWLFRAYLAGGDLDKAEAAFREGLSILERAGDADTSLNHLRLWRNYVRSQLLAGRPGAAHKALEQLRPLVQQHKEQAGTVVVALADVAWPAAPNPATVSRRLAAVDELLPKVGGFKTLALLTRARVSRTGGDLPAAARSYEEALRLATKDFQNCPADMLPAGLEWAETLQQLGQLPQAKEALAKIAPCAERVFDGSPGQQRWRELARR